MQQESTISRISAAHDGLSRWQSERLNAELAIRFCAFVPDE
jgi:hypothetical protein